MSHRAIMRVYALTASLFIGLGSGSILVGIGILMVIDLIVTEVRNVGRGNFE